MQSAILSQLKILYEGRCSPEGFIQPNSITILNYSLGRVNYIRGGVDYDVTFQADVCMPHSGQRFSAPVTLRSKVGIHAETPPIKILIPRDLHMGQEEFEKVNVGDDIEFEVVGTQFKQQDTDIIIVGKLLTKIKEEIELPLLSAPEVQEIPVQVSSQPQESEEKKIIVTQSAPEKPKKRKLKQSGGEDINEQFPSFPQGVAQGAY